MRETIIIIQFLYYYLLIFTARYSPATLYCKKQYNYIMYITFFPCFYSNRFISYTVLRVTIIILHFIYHYLLVYKTRDSLATLYFEKQLSFYTSYIIISLFIRDSLATLYCELQFSLYNIYTIIPLYSKKFISQTVLRVTIIIINIYIILSFLIQQQIH